MIEKKTAGKGGFALPLDGDEKSPHPSRSQFAVLQQIFEKM